MNIKNITLALIDFHKKVGHVSKNSTNPYFKSKYGDLNAYLEVIKKPLQECGLTIVQMPITNGLKSILMHESGEYLESECTIPELTNDPQKFGAVVTYLRRYFISSILLLQAEDTDANDTQTPKADMQKMIHELYTEIKNPSDELKTWIDQVKTHSDKELIKGIQKLKDIRSKQ